MKKLLALFAAFVLLLSLFTLTACEIKPSLPPDDGNGNGGTVVEKPDGVDNDETESDIDKAGSVDVSDVKNDVNCPDDAVALSGDEISISEGGNYYITGAHTSVTITKKITAHLYFDGVTLNNDAGKAFSTDKKSDITLTLIGENSITNGSDNAVHIKGDLTVNGSGSLTVTSNGKNGIKVSKQLTVVDASLNVSSQNHGITAETIVANGAKINITSAKKDGLHAECDYEYDKDEGINVEECVFTKDAGFVSLVNVDYSCDVKGDGIQADTFVYINGGNYNIKTTGEFVKDTTANRQEYGLISDDFRYQYRNGVYKKVASDEARGTLYALTQGCKGIKVGEIEFDSNGDDEDDYVVTEGDYIIMIKGGTFVIDSTDDALHTNSGDVVIDGGTFTINTTDDGMHADQLLKINGGNIDVQTSYEGLEGGYVEINGGTIKVVATDDGINAASDDRTVKEHIIVTDGTITVDAEGDGIDSNGTVLISGGTVTVFGPTTGGNGGLDADNGILVDGGTVFVTSALGMVETPGNNSKQYVVSYGSKSSLGNGDVISVKDSDGNVLIQVTLIKSCQSVIVSIDGFKKGSTYSLYKNDTLLESFTVSNILTTIGTQSGGFGPGGNRPGGRW